MLSYAFQVLNQSNYEEVAKEEFEKVEDLFAAILARGIARQLKQGLYRTYIARNETLSVMCILRRRVATGAFSSGHSELLSGQLSLSHFSFNKHSVMFRYPFEQRVG